MSKGFVILAQNTDTVKYTEQAYALALSIKATQKINNVSLITSSEVPAKYADVFDQIIPIPWFEDTVNSTYAAEHRWKLFHATPYEETIALDADMLFLSDVSHWWDHCKAYDLKFCSHVRNYKYDVINVDLYHRRTFVTNHLCNPYFGLHYFKKTDLAYEFYKTLEYVTFNWGACYKIFAPNDYQSWQSMDLNAAIALQMMGIEGHALDTNGPLLFTHMKPAIQGWLVVPSSWQNSAACMFTSNGELTVANIKQDGLFHYVEKDFITADIIRKLEALVNV